MQNDEPRNGHAQSPKHDITHDHLSFCFEAHKIIARRMQRVSAMVLSIARLAIVAAPSNCACMEKFQLRKMLRVMMGIRETMFV